MGKSKEEEEPAGEGSHLSRGFGILELDLGEPQQNYCFELLQTKSGLPI